MHIKTISMSKNASLRWTYVICRMSLEAAGNSQSEYEQRIALASTIMSITLMDETIIFHEK